jgi:hypothetical protein
MKNLILMLFCIFYGCINAQNWRSIPKAQSFGVPPVKFLINPYNNQMWFIGGTSLHMLDTNGQNRLFQSELQGNLYAGNDMSFAFTAEHTYFSDNGNGLYTFDNYIKNLIYPHSDIRSLKSDADTVYIIRSGSSAGFYKYCNSSVVQTNKTVSNLAAKNSFIYCDIGILAQIAGPNSSDWNLLYYDPQYMSGVHHEFKFSRKSDSLYVCGKKGISYAYNYDFLDTIAPNNSINMPARNVLEIEFDQLDRLWAVFGDASNKAFALARFDNGTWVEKYDASNCPINFATYRGFEIDTLGNIWVVDDFNLHTLLTPNSPIWLSTVELKKDVSMNIYPNPSSGTVNISSTLNIESIAIYDCMGRLVYSEKMNASKTQDVNISFLENGNYVLEASSGSVVSRSQFILVK